MVICLSIHFTVVLFCFFFFFNDTATTEIYTLSLHDALPIPGIWDMHAHPFHNFPARVLPVDRKSTRLNSSHVKISYAVFCLKKKNTTTHVRHIFGTALLDRNLPDAVGDG